MADQDWESTTVIRKRKDQPKVARKESDLNSARRAGATIATDRKAVTNKGHQGLHYQQLAKIDYADDVVAPPKLKSSVPQAIQTARNSKGLTQKDLGSLINEKPTVVAEYESGRAIPSQQILAKLERSLGVKLRGSNIGEPLPKRGSK
ncbi:multiprotein-bridging factor 1 [Dimargaris cristalligena]|uniref:YlMBF1 n=1 Tax=Dimargaris cristalligena TaxID=215637 RepID=A0A4P9ZUP0_9FUNG|nr:multiprotein-bridging factor 1 [Dimargaris cristalligena]RKP36611.1 ylMBF1 [Dimargaris cristalligena]|eukprot:RKP36611.1 ylMBF1 [Dimargaris cristalligena]